MRPNQRKFYVEPNREFRFLSYSLREAEARGREWCDFNQRVEDGEHFEIWMRGYRYIRVQLDENQGIPASICE